MKFTPALRATLMAGVVSLVLVGADRAEASVNNKYLGGSFSSNLSTSYNTSYGVSFDTKGNAFFQSNKSGGVNLPTSYKPSSLALDNHGNLFVVTSDTSKVTFTPAVTHTDSVYVSDYSAKTTSVYTAASTYCHPCPPPPCWPPCSPPPPCGPPPPCDPYAVPEPSTYAMLAAGLGMLAFWTRRRRSAALVPVKFRA